MSETEPKPAPTTEPKERGKSNNSVVDLIPFANKALEDGKWHEFVDVVFAVQEPMGSDRAVRFYQGQGGAKQARNSEGGDKRPLDERIKVGQGRGAYLLLRAMMKRGIVECQDWSLMPPEARKFRLLPGRGKRKRQKKAPPTKSKSKPLSPPSSSTPNRESNPTPPPSLRTSIENACALVDRLHAMLSSAADRQTQDDVDLHCGALRRIALKG